LAGGKATKETKELTDWLGALASLRCRLVRPVTLADVPGQEPGKRITSRQTPQPLPQGHVDVPPVFVWLLGHRAGCSRVSRINGLRQCRSEQEQEIDQMEDFTSESKTAKIGKNGW
jgi:hypothetical protein